MVETVGVEPTSESNPPPESTCVVYALDWIKAVHKQTASTLRSQSACEAERTIPLNDVLSKTVGESQ
jgi:hypothetical protein